MPADSPNDAVGTPITIGATVKLVGVVTAMNLFDNRYNDIEVLIAHPLAANVGPPTDIATGGDRSVPGYRIRLTFPPAVLLVGA